MKIGFLGAGNMATAMLRGALTQGYAQQDVFVFDIDMQKSLNTGATVCHSEQELVQSSELIFLCVKPNILPSVLETIAPVCGGRAFISIAAGVTSDFLCQSLKHARVLRVMPNTCLLVGEGAVALSLENTLTQSELAFVEAFFSMMGKVCKVHESQMDAVTGLSGSGPAYAFLMIEALADAGVREGLSRDTAYLLAAQTLKGAAQMVLQTGEHPGVLKDAVTSPAGTTADGLYALEKAGVRAAMIDAVHEATVRSRALRSPVC